VPREAAAGPRRVQPLPTRLHWAVGEFVTRSRRVLSQVAGYWAGQAMGRQVVKGANAQQFREAETITVEFEPERRKLEDDETAPT
jgi:peptide methionine sulfoxide reductase MsrA